MKTHIKNLAFASGLLFALGANASSHREAPLISNDPLADNTDLYLFRSPDNPNLITIVANYVPLQLPQGGPNYYSFGENIRYEIHVDNDASTPGDDIVYRFTFHKVNQDPSTFFNIRLGQQNLKTTYTLERSVDGGATFQTVISNGVVPPPNIGDRSIMGGAGLGASYASLRAGAVTMASSGEKVFCGPVDDPFFVDLGGIFDLGDAPRQMGMPQDGVACKNVSTIVIQVPISTLQKDGLSVSSATSILDPNFVIGVWASASRQTMRTLSIDGTVNYTGDWVQVSRLGMPLTNEAVIPIGYKDRWNSETPYEDLANLADYGNFFYNPELALYMDDDLFGGAVPAFAPLRIQRNSLQAFDFGNGHDGLYGLKGSPAVAGTALDDAIFGTLLLPAAGSPRSVDLWPIFHTGVPNLAPYQLATGKNGNPLAAGKPFINNFLPNGGDMLRLNMAVPITPRNSPTFSNLGIIAAAVSGLTDPTYNATASLQFIPNMDGFPNGRRLEDDVTRIELEAVSGVALAAIGLWYDDYTAGGPNPVTQDLLDVLTYTTGVEANDASFSGTFPYEAAPWSGTSACGGEAVAYTQPTVLPPSNGAPCTENLTLTFTTDNFDSEISWEFRRDADNSVTASGGGHPDVPGNNMIVENVCLPIDAYRLIVTDAGGNGITGGGYVLSDAQGRRIIDANGMFTSTSSVILPFDVPLSNMKMQGNSCDRTNVTATTTLYALSQPGAQQYQFWFFDPHGSYSRRIIRTPNTIRPNQMVTSPLPVNMDLNVRVRVKVGGVYGPYGATCRVRLVGGGMERQGMLDDAVTLSLYPNPTQGDQVHLLMENLQDEQQHIEVDLYDAVGRHVYHDAFGNEGATLNTTLSLHGDLAKGAYSVRVAVNGAVRSERLMVQ
jgi:hypothetical protein